MQFIHNNDLNTSLLWLACFKFLNEFILIYFWGAKGKKCQGDADIKIFKPSNYFFLMHNPIIYLKKTYIYSNKIASQHINI